MTTTTKKEEQEALEKTKMITLITKYSDSIISNKKLNAIFGNVIADIITKHTMEAIAECKSEEEATSLTLIAILEIYIALVKSTYNIEKIIIDKYNISKYMIDPLKVEAMIATEKAFEKVVNSDNEAKRKKEAADKDIVGSKMYG